MSYLYVSTQGVGNAKGATEGLGGLKGTTTKTATFMGQKVTAFTQDSALKKGQNWRRDDNAAIQDLGAITDQKLNDHLDGRNFFGKTESGSGTDTSLDAGKNFAVNVSANVAGTGLVVGRDSFTNATMEIALDHAEAVRFGSVTIENLANANVRVGDGLVQEGCGPCGPTRLDLDTVAKGEFVVNLVNVEDSFVDASSAKFAGGVDINIAVYSNDGACGPTHTHVIAGSVFADEVTITAGSNGGAKVETGDNIKVFANLGIGNDTFDSTSKGGLITVDRVIGGQGDDLIKTGAGKDTIFGDYDCKLCCSDAAAGDMVDLIGNGGTYLSDKTFFSATAKVGFVGSEAGYKNVLGYYYTDEKTGQRVGKLVWDEDAANAEAREGGKVVANIKVDGLTVSEAKSLGFFIISNGGNLNKGVSDTESASKVPSMGGRDGLVDAFEGGGNSGKVIVVQGTKGQGQVWLDTDGSGTLTAGDRLLNGQTSNGLTTDTGIKQGTGANTSGVANDVFSGFFSHASLNPNAADYTKNAGNVGDAFKDKATGAGGNVLDVQADTQWGQVGFEDLYAGKTGQATDRDYDDSVLQVQVTYKVGKVYGNDTLYGGGGDDTIYGDDNCKPCDSKEGGNDTIYGDDGLICVTASSIAGWVTGTGLTIYGRIGDGGPLRSVSQGDLADASFFDAGDADTSIVPANFPDLVLGINNGASGNIFGADPRNAEVNTAANGASDYLGFRLPTAADVAKVTLATFYSPDGSGGGRIESIIVKVGNDLNKDGDLADAGELLGMAQILADGTVLSVDDGFVVSGTPLNADGSVAAGPNGYTTANPGLFSICFQAAGVDEACRGTAALSFTDIVLESGGLYTKTGAGNAPTDYTPTTLNSDPSDFYVTGLCYVPEQGNDTIFGGGGDDTITAGGDRGSFSFALKVNFVGSLAWLDNGFGWYNQDTKTGEIIDARVKTSNSDGPWSTIGDYDADATSYANGTGNAFWIKNVASNALDKIGFFETVGRVVKVGDPDIDQPWAPVLGENDPAIDGKIKSGDDVKLVDTGDGHEVVVTSGLGSGTSLGLGRFTDAALNKGGDSQGITNPSQDEFGQVISPAPFTTVSDLLAAKGVIGFEDDFLSDYPQGDVDFDYNDVVVSLDLKISDKDKGDWICGGKGADTFIWNGASGGACQLPGGRGDGFDVIKDFSKADGDKLVFDAFINPASGDANGSASVLDVTVDGQNGVLVFDQNYAAGTGVLLLGVTTTQVQGAIMFV